MLRRWSAIAAWMLLLPVTMTAGDRWCAHHDGAPASQAENHEHHGQPEPPADEHPSCDTVIACSMTLESNADVASTPPQAPRARAITFAGTAPASAVRAPDTPPPKA